MWQNKSNLITLQEQAAKEQAWNLVLEKQKDRERAEALEARLKEAVEEAERAREERDALEREKEERETVR